LLAYHASFFLYIVILGSRSSPFDPAEELGMSLPLWSTLGPRGSVLNFYEVACPFFPDCVQKMGPLNAMLKTPELFSSFVHSISPDAQPFGAICYPVLRPP